MASKPCPDGSIATANPSSRSGTGKRSRGRGAKHESPTVHSKGPSTRGAATNGEDASRGAKKTAMTPSDAAISKSSKKSNKKIKKNKNSQQASEIRVKLKVVVRRLPPNLPEAIFWNTVEPWTGKQTLDQEKPAIRESGGKTQGVQSAKGPAEEVVKTIPDEDADMAEGERQPAEGAAKEASQSPPIKPKPLISLGCSGQEKLAWRRYISGKFKASGPSFASASTVITTGTASRDPSVLHKFSRAYLYFKNLEDLVEFHRNFDGHVFRDAAGNQSVALVEWAPYQKCPPTGSATKKKDKKEGTIHEDPDYLDFIKTLHRLDARTGEGAGESSREKTDAELLAHLTSSNANRDALQQASRKTPLLEFLRGQKKADATSRAVASGRGKTQNVNVGAGKATAVKGKHAKGGPVSARPTAATTPVQGDKPNKDKGKGKAVSPSTASQLAADGLQTSSGIPTGPKKKRKEKSGKVRAPLSTPVTAPASGVKVIDSPADNSVPASVAAAAPPTGPKGDRKANNKANKKDPGGGGKQSTVAAGPPTKSEATSSRNAAQPVILRRGQGGEDAQAQPQSQSGASSSHGLNPPEPQQQQQQQQPNPPTGPKNAARGGGNRGGGGRGGKGGRGATKAAAPS